jgi:hypothetical protein
MFRAFITDRGRVLITALSVIAVSGVTATAQQPSPPPPLPNRVNEALPSWLRLRAELRERMEGFEGSGYVEGRDDLYWLTRLRLTATIAPRPRLSFQIQAQDARVARKQVGPVGAPFQGPFDLRMAFAELGDGATPLTVRVGRQELAFGEQRLVGNVSWLNTARTFDGARATFKNPRLTVDTFATSVVRIIDDAFDKSGNGNWFTGAYATTTALIPKSSLEPFVFWRRDINLRGESGAFGSLEQTTVGVRWAGTLPSRLDYSTEMAAQTGSLATDSVRAWAGHWQLRRSLGGPGTVRVATEYNFASGDANPSDRRRGTFDQLYPTPHDKYGLADQVAWRNIHHLRFGAELVPGHRIQVTGSYHSWWLADTRDGLYAASGALVARVANGADSSHVGQELDLQLARALTPQLQLAGGLAHIFPGGFLRQATPGASYTYPYVMATYVFLAER